MSERESTAFEMVSLVSGRWGGVSGGRVGHGDDGAQGASDSTGGAGQGGRANIGAWCLVPWKEEERA